MPGPSPGVSYRSLESAGLKRLRAQRSALHPPRVIPRSEATRDLGVENRSTQRSLAVLGMTWFGERERAHKRRSASHLRREPHHDVEFRGKLPDLGPFHGG